MDSSCPSCGTILSPERLRAFPDTVGLRCVKCVARSGDVPRFRLLEDPIFTFGSTSPEGYNTIIYIDRRSMRKLVKRRGTNMLEEEPEFLYTECLEEAA